MSHLEKDILKGKRFKRGELKKEAREELEEVKGKKKGGALAKALEKKKGSSHIEDDDEDK